MLKRALLPFLLSASIVLPIAVLASQFDPSTLPYTDWRAWDRDTAVAVTYLTEDSVLQGNPDRTYRAFNPVNRAEFIHVADKLLITVAVAVPPDCFPDVPEDAWYAYAACRAKMVKVVQGNPVPGVPEAQWKFEPARNVNYAEAVKVMMEVYNIEKDDVSGPWYAGYLSAAAKHDLALSGVQPGDALDRGEMAKLVAAFRAFDAGELDELRAAQRGEDIDSSASSSRSSIRSSRSSSSRSSVSSVSSASLAPRSSQRSVVGYDPLTDLSIRSRFLVTGEVSPVIGAADFFSNNEPIDVRKVVITLATDAPSVDSLLVYDDSGRSLGRATRGSNTFIYTLTVPSGTFTLPRREERGVYVRAQIASRDAGGKSGEEVTISTIYVEGVGEWSNESNGESSTESFQTFETSYALLTRIANAGANETALSAGEDRLVGTFTFEGRRADGEADLRLNVIDFQIESAGVTLSDVRLRAEGADADTLCTVSSGVATCNAISETNGGLRGGPKTIRAYADVSIASGYANPFVRLTIGDPGTPFAAGDITWTDGSTTFTWVPYDAPVVRGTLYR